MLVIQSTIGKISKISTLFIRKPLCLLTCIRFFNTDIQFLTDNIPSVNNFPFMSLFMQETSQSLFATLDWQKSCARVLIKHYLDHVVSLHVLKEQCRYLHLPIGNIPADPTLFGADIFYARHLIKNNFVLWISETEKPDLGGREADDNR